jgi:hypothetical protein
MKDFLFWCSERYKTILLGSIATIVLCLTIFQFVSKREGDSLQEFLRTDLAFQKWITSSENDLQSLQKVRHGLDRHPELHAKLDAQIAQHVLYTKQDSESFTKFFSSKQKSSGALQYYTFFGDTALLIAQKKWKEALDSANLLKKQMDEDILLREKKAFGATLYGFNLLRIANLQKQLGLTREERLSWNELKAFVGWQEKPEKTRAHHDVGLLLEKSFQENQFSLKDYISYREKTLQASL